MTFSKPPLAQFRRAEFRTARFLFRPATVDDQPFMFGLRSDVDIARFLAATAPQAIENQLAWFDRVSQDTAYSYHIVEDEGVPIGFTSLFNADPQSPEAEWGVVMGKQRRPGTIKLFSVMFCLCAFKLNKLNALYGCINENNSGTIYRTKQMGGRLYEAPNIYRKKGELLLRIDSEEFIKETLPNLADDTPEWADIKAVEMHPSSSGAP